MAGSAIDKIRSHLFLLLILCILLYYGKTLFIPLSFALLISFLLYPICNWLESRGLNKSLAILTGLLIILLLIGGIIALLFQQLASFAPEWPTLKAKLSQASDQIINYLSYQFDVPKEAVENRLNVSSNISSFEFLPFIKELIYSSGVSLVLAVLIPFFSALMLYHRRLLSEALYSLFPVHEKPTIHKVLHLTIHTYYNFIKGMLIVYLIVGSLNSLGLLLLGIPHPFLFGFIASILTFIPYVGIIIASLLPITVSWLTYDSIWYPVGVIGVFTVVQYLEANIIFPLAVSSKLKVNALATLISILLGGILWGAAGMILFVPFVAILKLIADNAEGLQFLSRILGTEEDLKT
jgi:predicted PurR-regulated permease PerM